MRKLAFSFHLSGALARREKWWAFPPAPFPWKGVTLVRRYAAQGNNVAVPPAPTFGSGA